MSQPTEQPSKSEDNENTPPTPAPTTVALPTNTGSRTNPSPSSSYTTELSMHEALIFGRMDSDFTIVDVTLMINNQDTLSGLTYDQLESLTTTALPINRVNFIRMWKTILLKRVMDVFEGEKHRRAEHFVRLNRNLILPAPLADTIYSIGAYTSYANGTVYHFVPPARAADPEPWWTLDTTIFNAWNLTLNRLQHLFIMKTYPPLSEWDTRPLILTVLQVNGQYRRVKAVTNDPQPSDALITMLNDQLFQPVIPIADCHLNMCEYYHTDGIRTTYLQRCSLNADT